jgi:hypothetical protein
MVCAQFGAPETNVWVLVCTPPPHVSEQGVQGDQLLAYVQFGSGGQGTLQVVYSTVAPHALPPFMLGVTMERERACMPTPHEAHDMPVWFWHTRPGLDGQDTEHWLHADHGDMTHD